MNKTLTAIVGLTVAAALAGCGGNKYSGGKELSASDLTEEPLMVVTEQNDTAFVSIAQGPQKRVEKKNYPTFDFKFTFVNGSPCYGTFGRTATAKAYPDGSVFEFKTPRVSFYEGRQADENSLENVQDMVNAAIGAHRKARDAKAGIYIKPEFDPAFGNCDEPK